MVWYGDIIWICMVGRERGREVDERRAGVEGGSRSVRAEVEERKRKLKCVIGRAGAEVEE
jgi:hypothetical protein